MRGTAIVLALMLAGCASRATDVAPAYVSPMTYSSLSCVQLADEAARLVQQVNVVSGQQDSQATKDAVATGVAVVLFWPAAFLVQGDKGNAAQLANLKGQYNAVYDAGTRKGCANFQRHP